MIHKHRYTHTVPVQYTNTQGERQTDILIGSILVDHIRIVLILRSWILNTSTCTVLYMNTIYTYIQYMKIIRSIQYYDINYIRYPCLYKYQDNNMLFKPILNLQV